MWAWLLLLLPVALLFGWYFGYTQSRSAGKSRRPFPNDYFIGLKYLIDDEPDKAVDVFIKMLEVNSDTVETHLALGSLFRRRGEVNRAIRIHQNLIARPQLSKKQRVLALSELALDYMRAGVLDRAENLFLELNELSGKKDAGLINLLHIYEQQKDWGQAILVAKKLVALRNKSMQSVIAHYYCELGDPKKALAVDKWCVRASTLLGECYIRDANYKEAIRAYQKAATDDNDFISEIIEPLAFCYEKLGAEEEFVKYLRSSLKKSPRISIILALAGFLRKYHGDFAAIEFITEQMDRYPSLRGLNCLTEIYVDNSDGNTKHKLLLLQKIMHDLLHDKPIYRCSHCGFSGKILYWQCPGCRKWGLVKPIHGLEGD